MSNQQIVTAKEMALDANNPREREIMVVEREFALTQRKAQAMAASNIIPKEYQGNVANCIIAMEMAQRLNAGELEIMQNLHVIHGRPSFSAAYLIARVNQSGILRGRLKFVYVSQPNQADYGCYAIGTCAETGEELVGVTVDMAMAKAEGWSTKNGSKWKTMPQQMLMYRAASFWSRVYAPDATMGMHTVEESHDIVERDITPVVAPGSVQDMLAPKIEQKPAQDQQEAAEGQEEVSGYSPAFLTLRDELMATKTTVDANAVLKKPLVKKLNEAESKELGAIVINHAKAIDSGMLPE